MNNIYKNESDLKQFEKAISQSLDSSNIMTSQIQRYAYGTDASFYRLIPQMVLKAETEQQIQQIIIAANTYQISITFRAAGTSLSGQAITDSVLVLLSDNWRNIDICPDTFNVRLQPNVVGAQANKALLPHNRKIGPDPASINSCKIGGIAANNSSGMCCGVKDNSYHTLVDIRLVFADGSVLDTADKESRTQFISDHQDQLNRLNLLADKIKSSPELLAKVQHKYRLKNTTGYGINALVDFDDPIDMLSHLMIGSEGTLAFISDITYRTIKINPFKAVGLYLFDNTDTACQVVHQLAQHKVDAVEIMDAGALQSVETKLSALLNTNSISTNSISANSTGLLIEVSAENQSLLSEYISNISVVISAEQQHLLPSFGFTQDTAIAAGLWGLRKGMFPAVGAKRDSGTTVVIEDVAVPLELLSQGMAELQALFVQFGYTEAIIFGHALSGNLHFVFTQSFNTQEETTRYKDFMDAVCHLVTTKYQGSLKAEHGTGRNMAPFVELEWGSDLYQVMQELKDIFDPNNILNPGVIINDDPNAHIKNLKAIPAVHDTVDKCIECGFCEVVCPSKELTLTPRQRITVWRRIKQLEQSINATDSDQQEPHKQDPLKQELQHELQQLKKDYQYFGIDSCAATGLCAQQCPVDINTGEFIKQLRADSYDIGSQINKKNSSTLVAQKIAGNFSLSTKVAKLGLNTTNIMAKTVGQGATKGVFNLASKFTNNLIPKWYPQWPKANNTSYADNYNAINTFKEKVVYLPACPNRMFATDAKSEDQRSLQQVIVSLFNKAQIELIIPESVDSLCCGMPWGSKGLNDIKQQKQQQTVSALKQASDNGKWPVITDASPCSLTLSEQDEVNTFDVIEYVARYLLPKLTIKQTTDSYMLHNTCSSQKMATSEHLIALSQACTSNLVIPDNIYCCGFAGDKGLYYPELNDHALRDLKSQVPASCKGGLSNSRTCEIGLSKNSGIPYQSVLYLLDEVSVAKE